MANKEGSAGSALPSAPLDPNINPPSPTEAEAAAHPLLGHPPKLPPKPPSSTNPLLITSGELFPTDFKAALLSALVAENQQNPFKGILSEILKCTGDNMNHMISAVDLEKLVPYITATIKETKLGAEGDTYLSDWLTRQLSVLSDHNDAIHLLKPASSAMKAEKILRDIQRPALDLVPLEWFKPSGSSSQAISTPTSKSIPKVRKSVSGGIIKPGMKAVASRTSPMKGSRQGPMLSVQDIAVQSLAMIGVKDSDKYCQEDLYRGLLSTYFRDQVDGVNMLLARARGTTNGAIIYDNGILAFTDSRASSYSGIEKTFVTLIDDMDKHTEISKKSKLFYLSCGNFELNTWLADELKIFVKSLEKSGMLVSVDDLARYVDGILQDRFVRKPNTDTMGEIFIGPKLNERYGAYLIRLNKGGLTIESIFDDPDCEGLVQNNILVGGAGKIRKDEAVTFLSGYTNVDFGIAKKAAEELIISTSLSARGTGGSTYFYDFPHEHGGYLYEVKDPCTIHIDNYQFLKKTMYILRGKSDDIGYTAGFLDHLGSCDKTSTVSFWLKRKGNSYFQVTGYSSFFNKKLEASRGDNKKKQSKKKQSGKCDDSPFKSFKHYWGRAYIEIEIAEYSRSLLEEIGKLDYLE